MAYYLQTQWLVHEFHKHNVLDVFCFNSSSLQFWQKQRCLKGSHLQVTIQVMRLKNMIRRIAASDFGRVWNQLYHLSTCALATPILSPTNVANLRLLRRVVVQKQKCASSWMLEKLNYVGMLFRHSPLRIRLTNSLMNLKKPERIRWSDMEQPPRMHKVHFYSTKSPCQYLRTARVPWLCPQTFHTHGSREQGQKRQGPKKPRGSREAVQGGWRRGSPLWGYTLGRRFDDRVRECQYSIASSHMQQTGWVL